MCTDPVTFSTEVIAFAALANLAISFVLWRATQASADVSKEILELSNRPYVGLEGLAFTENPDQRSALIQASIKNFGIVAAQNCNFHWDVFVGGKLQPDQEMDVQPNSMTLFPSVPANLLGSLSGDEYIGVVRSNVRLEIIIYIAYDQGKRHYEYNEKHRYFPDFRAFMNLGETEKDVPAPQQNK